MNNPVIKTLTKGVQSWSSLLQQEEEQHTQQPRLCAHCASLLNDEEEKIPVSLGFSPYEQSQLSSPGSSQIGEHRLSWQESKIYCAGSTNKNTNRNSNHQPTPTPISSNPRDQTNGHPPNNLPDLELLARELKKQNIIYSKTLTLLHTTIQQIIITIQNKLISSFKNFNYFTDFSTECQLQQTINMAKFIESTVNKIAENWAQVAVLEQNLIQFKTQNAVLHKDNETLRSYIQERKVYSQKLKSKITQLKQQLKQATQKNGSQHTSHKQLMTELQQERQKNAALTKLIHEANTLQENADLKYRNRNDLIIMIKSLCSKIVKHQKECHAEEFKVLGDQVDKFLNNSTAIKKKSSGMEASGPLT